MLIHLDLFSGIGGFALAAQAVWGDEYECAGFVEIDPYCQALLKLRFPGVKIYGDIRTVGLDTNANANSDRCSSGKTEVNSTKDREQTLDDIKRCDRTVTADTEQCGLHTTQNEQELERKRGNKFCIEQPRTYGQVDLITGGFPCQPFSQAGKRRGTQDNRFLWPEMLRVIKDFKPQWVVAENVRGLLTIEGGVVFESCLSDLEAAGYETQAFIIPACAVNAPHRRDRVWIVAYSGRQYGTGTENNRKSERAIFDKKDASLSERPDSDARKGVDRNSIQQGLEGWEQLRQSSGKRFDSTTSWQQNWLEVATRLCGVDDGLPAELDGLELSKAKHRVERLKSLGNSIVPQVAMEIMYAIKLTDMMERL